MGRLQQEPQLFQLQGLSANHPAPTVGADVGQDLVHNALVLRCQMLIIRLGRDAMSYLKGLMILCCKE